MEGQVRDELFINGYTKAKMLLLAKHPLEMQFQSITMQQFHNPQIKLYAPTYPSTPCKYLPGTTTALVLF